MLHYLIFFLEKVNSPKVCSYPGLCAVNKRLFRFLLYIVCYNRIDFDVIINMIHVDIAVDVLIARLEPTNDRK
jgi:hypothetical protein